jgi:hypothetical protein
MGNSTLPERLDWRRNKSALALGMKARYIYTKYSNALDMYRNAPSSLAAGNAAMRAAEVCPEMFFALIGNRELEIDWNCPEWNDLARSMFSNIREAWRETPGAIDWLKAQIILSSSVACALNVEPVPILQDFVI